jgi:hypothetical protein
MAQGGREIVSQAVAARAALSAYAAACRSGAKADVAVAVALARYRSFFPLAGEDAVRQALAHALSVERLRARGLILATGEPAAPVLADVSVLAIMQPIRRAGRVLLD